MKNYRSFLAVAALGMASAASAQNLNSGYFTEGYLYRHVSQLKTSKHYEKL